MCCLSFSLFSPFSHESFFLSFLFAILFHYSLSYFLSTLCSSVLLYPLHLVMKDYSSIIAGINWNAHNIEAIPTILDIAESYQIVFSFLKFHRISHVRIHILKIH